MARDTLGLFDTSPDRQEIRIGIAIVVLVVVLLLAALPASNIRLGAIPGFVPTITATILVCDLITAAILYAQAGVFRSRALTVLAAGYVVEGLLLIPWALTFPGIFSPTGLLGAKVNTTGWIGVCWRLSVPTAIMLYAWLKRAEKTAGPVAERPSARIALGVLVPVALAALVTLLATVGHDLLPSYFANEGDVIRSRLIAANVVMITVTIAAMVLLFRQERSVLDLWLLVSMSAWLAQALLNVTLQSRFTFGAHILLGLVLVSNLIIMLALLTESIRLYARLALSTAARDRERDTRLMSMDAVAAAIAHEVGQPLTATKLSASAAMRWLTQSRPDRQKAIKSLRDTLDSGERTFDVIRSIRATFANGAGTLSLFNLNNLVRETAALMDGELAARKVELQLELEEDLPPIMANRVQIQRVLINLLTNAIESMATNRRRTRRIAIRTVPADGDYVLLEVNDSGTGILPDEVDRIFEPFFTTKATGTGLGLSLSRTIIEEHGGRLWASPGDHGTTFHVCMKRGPKAA